MRELRRRGYWRGVIEFELIIILVISFKRIVSDWDYESFWGCSRLSTSDNAVHSVNKVEKFCILPLIERRDPSELCHTLEATAVGCASLCGAGYLTIT